MSMNMPGHVPRNNSLISCCLLVFLTPLLPRQPLPQNTVVSLLSSLFPAVSSYWLCLGSVVILFLSSNFVTSFLCHHFPSFYALLLFHCCSKIRQTLSLHGTKTSLPSRLSSGRFRRKIFLWGFILVWKRLLGYGRFSRENTQWIVLIYTTFPSFIWDKLDKRDG